jgi:autotransporter-associated beta strand protein
VGSNGTLSIGGSNVELSGNFSGSATLTKTGIGILTLSGSASTFSGNLVISGGSGANSIVKAGSASAFGTGTVRIMGSSSNTGSTFDLNGYSLDNTLVVGIGNSGVADQGALINSNAGSAAVINGAVSLGGEIYVGGAGDIRFNGVVSGGVNPSNAYSIYKDGAGTWTFANTTNTFDGFYYQFNGTTEVASLGNINEDSSLGRATDANRNRVVFGFNGNGGGTLRYIGSNSSTSDRVFVLGGSTAAASNTIEAAGTNSSATLTLTGGLSAGRNAAYTARLAGNNTGANTYAGVIANGSGTVALEKNGTGTWILSGNNTYSGGTTISAGTLQIGTTGLLGGGNYSGNIAMNGGNLLFATSSNQSLSGVISGTGGLTKNGTGMLTLTGMNTFSGGVLLNTGTLLINSNYALGNGTLTIAGGKIDYTTPGITLDNNPQNWNADIDFVGTTDLDLGTGQIAMNASRTVSVSSGNLTIGGAITGSGFGLAKAGSGNLILAGSSSYSGATTINAGTITLATANAIASGSSLNVASGAAFDLSGHNQTLGSISGVGNISLGSGTLTTNSSSNSAFSGAISGSGALTKAGSGTLTLSGNNSYTGPTSLTAGTVVIGNANALGTSGNVSFTGGGLQYGTGIDSDISLRIKNSVSAILVDTNGNNVTFSGAMDSTNSGGLTKNGSGTLSLAGNNNFTGGTTLNSGTLVIGNTAAAGTGTISQASGASVLQLDTTGTITNAMSVYNVLATQSATLSGAITVNNATWDVETGDTLTINGSVSGNGGVTKNGGGTLILSGSNSYSNPTILNNGTLNAANANALGTNATVQVNGGTLLVTADDAINSKNITLNTNGVGLKFSGTYNGSIGLLTLSANSTLDLGIGSVLAMFSDIDFSGYNLKIYNWTGETLWGGTNRNNTDQVYIMAPVDPDDLNRISFYSGNYGTDSFLGTGFELAFSSGYENQIIPVPEPETWATGILLVLGGAWWMWRNRKAEVAGRQADE